MSGATFALLAKYDALGANSADRIEELIDREKLSGSYEAKSKHFGGCFMNGIRFYDYFDQNLLPCPFCSAEPARSAAEACGGGVFVQEKRVPVAERDYFNSGDVFTVICRTCRVKLSRANMGAAVDAWNRRTQVTN